MRNLVRHLEFACFNNETPGPRAQGRQHIKHDLRIKKDGHIKGGAIILEDLCCLPPLVGDAEVVRVHCRQAEEADLDEVRPEGDAWV